MPEIDYQYQFQYLFSDEEDGPSFPGLLVQVRDPASAQIVEVSAHLDTGAECSLFDGWIARAIGLDLMSGEPVQFTSTAGHQVDARWHNVELSHDPLGSFPVRVAFSLSEIRRNLLGRDFLNLIQIGFRERHGQFYVTPTP